MPHMRQGRYYRKKCRRYDTEWGIHCLTFSCFGRKPLLDRDRTRSWFVESLDRARERLGFDLWAYVIMPEHVHLIIRPRDGVKIKAILSGIKLPVTRNAMAWVRENAMWFLRQMEHRHPDGRVTRHFWLRGGGHDRNILSNRELYRKIRYIHLNPVRRKLVGCAEEWPWSSCRTYYFNEPGLIRLDLETLPPPDPT